MTAQWYVHDILMGGLPGTIFQQDNARPYTARMSQEYIHHITTLPWPARSPDLSPIGISRIIWDSLRVWLN
ncbi:hypothetical protein TNCV_2272911 [Trichonephila clavipes]|nr:hypothetical protein TNCV_2272911 [Trichonephila clavipes]